MKKILIFSIAYCPFVGGAEVAVKEITDRVRNFSFDMVTLNLGKKLPKFEKIGNVGVHRIGGGKLLFPILAFIKARRLHRKNGYDLIWSIMANRAGFAAMFFKHNFSQIPFVLTLQEGDPIEETERKVKYIYPLFRKIFTLADHVTAISSYLANWAKEMRASFVIIVPNGVDLDKFKISNIRPQNLGGEKIIITTSRLVPKNGIADLISAIKYLPDSIKLWIIGTGPLEENLKSRISNLKLEDRVKMFGFMEHAEIIEHLRQADVFVRPSLSEGLGNSFLEAMALGVPIIGTNAGGIPDFLRDGETGLFCKTKNPRDIAEKVQKMLEDDTLRGRVVNNARMLIEETYDWREIAKNMGEIFQRQLKLS